MDRASRVFAAPTQFTLGGKSLLVNGRILKHFGEVEQAILSRRPNPFKLARDNTELFKDQPDMQRELVRLAMAEATSRNNFVTRFEIQQWLDQTLDGTVFALYLALRDNDVAYYTIDRVRQLYLDDLDEITARHGKEAAEKRIQETKDKIDEASGADPLGNSTGSVRPSQDQASTSLTPGDESSAS